MRGLARLRAFLTLVVVFPMVAGCVIPVMEEEPFKPEVVHQITIGQSTRGDVLLTLGEPYTVTANDSLFAYSSVQLHAIVVAGSPYGGGGAFPLATRHNLVIAFSEEGIVEQVKLVTGSLDGYCLSDAKCFPVSGNIIAARVRWKETLARQKEARTRLREELLPKANLGDVDAQYALAGQSENQEERWRWICLAAHGGHKRGQHLMAAHYRVGIPKSIGRDDVKAYLWYSLAARNGDAQAETAVGELLQVMPALQIDEAKHQVEIWKPNPEECNGGGTRE